MMFGWIYFAHGDTIATSVPVSLLLHCQCLTSLNQLSCSLGTVEIMPEIEADMTWINNMICHVYMIGVCVCVCVCMCVWAPLQRPLRVMSITGLHSTKNAKFSKLNTLFILFCSRKKINLKESVKNNLKFKLTTFK